MKRGRRPAEAKSPDTAQVAVVWPCDGCGHWVRSRILASAMPEYCSGRRRFLCRSCATPPDTSGGLFGEWLDEQRGSVT